MLILRVDWDTALDERTAPDRLIQVCEMLRALGWDAVYNVLNGERPRLISRTREKLLPAEVAEGPDGISLSREPVGEIVPGGWAILRLRGSKPSSINKSGLTAGIPSVNLELARAVLRRLVHLTNPVFAGVGPSQQRYAFVYFGRAGTAWLSKNAAEVKLSSEPSLGGWILAHGEALDSRSVSANDAVEALSRTVKRCFKAESAPPSEPPPGATLGSGDGPDRRGVGPAVPSATPPYAPTELATSMADPDATALPFAYLGPVLPFVGTTSVEQVRVMLQPPEDAPDVSGDTVAIGESPFMLHGFSLVRYASLRAALARHGEEHEPTLRQFGLDIGGKRALQQAFFDLFQQMPNLLPTFTQLVEIAKLRQG